MMPTSAAQSAVVMNSAIFTRGTGTPTLRAATGSPPTPKIQLPTRVREDPGGDRRDGDPPDHVILKSCGAQKVPPKMFFALS